jgi:alpha/beta superfamily hydrolase
LEHITFVTDDGLTLEGEIHRPAGTVRAGAVICHPHPRYGGSKDHPVLWALRIELTRRGFVVLAFNFRGVMGSEGISGTGADEPADVRAALDRIGAEAQDRPLFLAGWSFGANVALRTAIEDDRPRALALLALPLSDMSSDLPPRPEPERLARYVRPVLLVAGEDDHLCPVPELLGVAGQIPKVRVEVIPGANHFFAKKERVTAEVVAAFAEEALFEG